MIPLFLAVSALAEPTYRPANPTPPAERAATERVGAIRRPDDKTGWGDVKWGGPRPGDCEIAQQEVDQIVCTRKGDAKVADLDVTVVYLFWEDKLFTVGVLANDASNARRLKAGLENAYGPGAATDPFTEQWDGEKVSLRYVEDPMTGTGTAWYFHLPTLAARDAADQAAARERAKAL